MQVARLSIDADAPIVVDAIRRVGALLNLTDEQPLADGMERAGRNEERIPLLHRHMTYDLKECVVRNAPAKFIFFDRMCKTVENLRPRGGIDDVPELRLAVLPLHAQGIVVTRMHLHGEIVVCIDQLDEQREIGKLRSPRAECLCPRTCQPRLERLPCRCAAGNNALSVTVTGKLPALCHLWQLRALAVLVSQPRSAPEVVLERCLELHWIFHRSHPFPRSFIGLSYRIPPKTARIKKGGRNRDCSPPLSMVS